MARTFVLHSPPMHGSDVRQLQSLVNGWFKNWGVAKRLKEDGQYGLETKRCTMQVAYGLGIGRDVFANGVTPRTRSKIRHAGQKKDLRSLAERRRARGRRGWIKRFAARSHAPAAGIKMAIAYADKMEARRVHEVPAGSNLGPMITVWEKLAGYRPPPGVFWCGCYVNALLVAGGLPSQAGIGIGFVPNVIAAARGGRDGWSWHTEPEPGDCMCFGPGAGEHIEFVKQVVEVEGAKVVITSGGNTSAGDGSPNNGGEVAEHDFRHYHGLPLIGYARPPWKH